MRIAVGADHGGFELKQEIVTYLKSRNHQVRDIGPQDTSPVDYPVYAERVARAVATGTCDLGIMVDGAGIGSAMAANKVKGIRAAACYNVTLARNSREHNGANVLTLGAKQTTNISEVGPIIDAFLETQCTADRHRRRVQMIMDIENGRTGASGVSAQNMKKEGNLELSPNDVERITQRVKEILTQGGSVPSPTGGPPQLGPEEIAGMIDHTILKPEASADDVRRLCEEALQYHFYSVCVNPVYVKLAADILRKSKVKVCAVVGFPLGAADPQIKLLEARKALREGAREIDMVINIGALKSGDDKLVLRDIRGVAEACREGRGWSKVILETSLLTDEEKVRACELGMKAGINYVKTSTGFSTGGATAEDIALMARTVASKKLGVKASGGVRTYDDAMKMIQNGATRIGSSNSVKIVEEASARVGGKE